MDRNDERFSVSHWSGRKFRSKLAPMAGVDERLERGEREGASPLLFRVCMIAVWLDGATLRLGRMRAVDVGPER